MLLLRHLTLQITAIFFLHRCDGFMFNSWLRSATEQNLSTPLYRFQNLPNTEPNRYESNKDTPKSNLITFGASSSQPTDKDVIAAYNNQRTGISAPSKPGKPLNGYNAVIVHSVPPFLQPSSAISYVAIPAQNYPYFYYRDDAKNEQQNNHVNSFTTTLAPRKSVQVELNYKDDMVVEKVGDNIVLQQKVTTTDTTTNATEIPTNNSSSPAEVSHDSVPSTQNPAENHANAISGLESGSPKFSLPNRPIKLVGLNPIYTLQSAHQKLAENFTFTPQLYYEPTANVQYAPYPFLRSLLVPFFGYRNVPRAVSERSEVSIPSPAVPLISPYPVLAPVIPQSFDFKSEHKLPTSNGLPPICENCLLPPNYVPYPSGLKLYGASETNQKPCSQETTSQASSFKSNLAYIFTSPQAVKKQ